MKKWITVHLRSAAGRGPVLQIPDGEEAGWSQGAGASGREDPDPEGTQPWICAEYAKRRGSDCKRRFPCSRHSAAWLLYQASVFKEGNMEFAAVSLMLSGAVSNLYDRFRRGYVVDYIGFGVPEPQIRKITFNIGDFCLMAGAAALAAAMTVRSVWKSMKKQGKTLLSGHK